MPRRSVIVLLALAMAALGCGGPLAGSPTSSPTPTTTVENTATPIPRTAILSELLNQVEARQDAQQVDWQTATDGQQISVGGGAKTSNESRVRIDTSEGTIVRVAPNSEFELTVFSPQVTNPATRLKLAFGKLWALALGITEPDAFEIETPTGSATVRGSLMSVDQDSATGRMLVTCLEGACRLSNPAGASVDLAAGEQSEIPAAGLAPLPARPMDRAQLEDWLSNFPEALAAARRLLEQLPTPTPTLPPPSAGFNVSESGAAEAPQLAFDAQGTLHVVWRDARLRPNGDYVHRQMTPDGQWGETQNLTEGFAFLYGSLSLLPYPDGRMCALWNGAQTGTSDIGVYRRCREVGWAPAELITTTTLTARDFSFVLTPDGTLQALYISSAGDIYFNDLKLSGDELAARPVFVTDSVGDYHAVWVTLSDPFTVVHRYRYTVVEGGGRQLWLDPDNVSTAESAPDGLSLSVATDEQGGIHVVWSGANGLYYRRWSLANGWERPGIVALDERGPNPDMAVDAEGRARVVWGRFDGLYYVAQEADGAWSAPSRFSDTPSDAPQIVIDAQGTSHIVWVTNGDVYYLTLP